MRKNPFLFIILAALTTLSLGGCNLFFAGSLEEANCQDDQQCPGGACVRGVCTPATDQELGADDLATDSALDADQTDLTDLADALEDAPDLDPEDTSSDLPDLPDTPDLDPADLADVTEDAPEDAPDLDPADAQEDAPTDLPDLPDAPDLDPMDLEDLPDPDLNDLPDPPEDVTPDLTEDQEEDLPPDLPVCDPDAHLDDPDDCGCQGPCPAPHSQCQAGICKPVSTNIDYGTFDMGAPPVESTPDFHPDEALHTVTLTRNFAALVTEVTCRQWRSLMNTIPEGNPEDCDQRPVVNVSWQDAMDYANALNAAENLSPCDLTGGQNTRPPYNCEGWRLPTEAEWEYLARAGSQDAFWSGPIQNPLECDLPEASLSTVGRYCYRGEDAPSPVAQLIPNSWMLYDVHGNAAEWTLDGYRADYEHLPNIDPFDTLGTRRVIKGGSYLSVPVDCRAASRRIGEASQRFEDVGFRLVRSLESCDPSAHAQDTDNCGCTGPCPAGRACEGGQCACIPRAHNFDDDNCGCLRACGAHETCQRGQCVQSAAFIPPGSFFMGTEDAPVEDDERGRQIQLTHGFFLQRAELTQALWSQLHPNVTTPPFFHTNCPDCPAENVSWYNALDVANRLSDYDGRPTCFALDECVTDVFEFINLCGSTYLQTENMSLDSPYDCLGWRLPTEAEWEYAARAGTEAPFACGVNASCLDEIAWTNQNSSQMTHPAATKNPNNFGLFDMFGNVEEWTLDAYTPSYYGECYNSQRGTDPWCFDANNSPRSARGGAALPQASDYRAANRESRLASDSAVYRGFRLARTCQPEEHMDDPAACGCEAACGPLERCLNGRCAPAEVAIPAGSFTRGALDLDPDADPTARPHTVTLTRPISAQITEITQQQWARFDPRTPRMTNPAWFGACGPLCPIENISWVDALRLANAMSENADLQTCYDLSACNGAAPLTTCASLTTDSPYDCDGYRLPTEAEWEYLARAGTITALWSGPLLQTDCDPLDLAADHSAWYCANSHAEYEGCFQPQSVRGCLGPHPVGQRAPNAWGLYDVHGNVAEWTFDAWIRDPSELNHTDPVVIDARIQQRAARGGSWASRPPALRAANRAPATDGSANHQIGLRLVRTLTND